MSPAFSQWLAALPAITALSLVAWAIATARRNVGLVDIFWPLFFLVAAAVYAVSGSVGGPRGWLAVALITAWGLRLSGYLAARNWNAPEDRRYRAIRKRNEPGFTWKSLYIVFGLQALLAWLISAPLGPAIRAAGPFAVFDALGGALAVFGIAYEAIADRQLAKFLAEPGNSGLVMNRGLWRYSRHPNYFGEFCVWWGLYLLAAGADGAWTVFSPLLVTILLLRVSGVSLLEKDIGERRQGYREYVRRTNAFVPGPARKA